MNKNLRMVLEIIIVPVAIMYLIYLLCDYVSSITNVIFIVFTVITAFELIVKGIKYIYSYGHVIIKKVMMGLLIISNVCLLFSLYWVNYQASNIYMNYLLYITLAVLLIYALVSAIICMVRITNAKGKLYTNVTTSFLYFLSFLCITMTGILLYIKG